MVDHFKKLRKLTLPNFSNSKNYLKFKKLKKQPQTLKKKLSFKAGISSLM